MDNRLKKAVEVLRETLKTDEGYRIAWQANIAMAFKDAYWQSEDKEEIHEISNRAADNFLNLICKK